MSEQQSTDHPPVPEETRQVAELVVALTSDDPAEREYARSCLARMECENTAQVETARRMQCVMHHLQNIHAQGLSKPASAALGSVLVNPKPVERARSRRLLSGAALMFFISFFLWLFIPDLTTHFIQADARTGTGQRHTLTLDDGSRITLESLSAVSVDYSDDTRHIRLLRGEIHVDVEKDLRPFVVSTEHGTIEALGTRFLVSLEKNRTWLSMLHSQVRVESKEQVSADSRAVFSAGQRVAVEPDRIGPVMDIDAAALEKAWLNGQLWVDDWSLAEVLAILSRHHTGRIQFDAQELSRHRVTALLPLHDTARALSLLEEGMPELRIRSMTPFLVVADLR